MLTRVRRAQFSDHGAARAQKVHTLLQSMFPEYEVRLHGSWFLGTASDTSDIDVSIVANEKKLFGVIMRKLQKRLAIPEYRCIRLVTVVPARLKVIQLQYYEYSTSNTSDQSTRSIRIDLTLQRESQMQGVAQLREAISVYKYYDLYRAVKIVLDDHGLYGLAAGGLNSFTIGWMIYAMIRWYETFTDILSIHANWFGPAYNDEHLHAMLHAFCNFYTALDRDRMEIRITNGHVVYQPLRLNPKKRCDVEQPYILRLYVNNKAISIKSYRYDEILKLFYEMGNR